MTHNQYEQHKRRLEEQLRAGIQLLETAYQAQIRALDLVWKLQVEAGELETFVAPEPSPAPSRPRRRGAGELDGDIRAALPLLPETFSHRDVREALGYEPDRGSLYRILQDLVRAGSLRVESTGTGQIPTTYRKTGVQDADGAG